MAMQISEKTQKQIDELVASGRYADDQTVIMAALRLLIRQEGPVAVSGDDQVAERADDKRSAHRIQEAAERYEEGGERIPTMKGYIEVLAKTGRYGDQESIIEAAIAELITYEHKLAWLKAEIDKGLQQIERGEFVEFTRERAEYLMQQAKENYKAGKPISDAVTP